MSLINWSDEYSVKISGIDNQHKKLVHLINDLHNAMKKGQGKEIKRKIINDLINYTQFHFTSEEQVMKQNNYPDYTKHKLAHEALTKKVLDYKKDLDEGKVVISQDILIFLKDWLVNHIIGMDKEYSPFLNSRGIV